MYFFIKLSTVQCNGEVAAAQWCAHAVWVSHNAMWICRAVKSVMLSLHTWATIPGVFRYDNYLTSSAGQHNKRKYAKTQLSLFSLVYTIVVCSTALQFPHSKVTYLEPQARMNGNLDQQFSISRIYHACRIGESAPLSKAAPGDSSFLFLQIAY